jgi:ribosomal protein S14
MLTARALAIAASVPTLTRLPLTRLEALLEPRRPSRESTRVADDEVQRAVERALALGRRLLRPTCMTRGVTRYYLLRRAGIDVALAFGLERADGHRNGHCWLVKDGEPFLEDTDPHARFIEVFRLPRTAAA